jgi:hypothetical protein
MTTVAPYGSWRSPIDAAVVARSWAAPPADHPYHPRVAPADLPRAAAVLERIPAASPPELAPERRLASVALSGGTLTLTGVVRVLDAPVWSSMT